MTSRSKSILKTAGLLAALIVCGPLLYSGARRFAALDPFGDRGAKWANPFGGDIGSIMQDVKVRVFTGPTETAAFHAGRIEIRRDKAFMTIDDVDQGTVFEGGKPAATFTAKTAGYDVSKDRLLVQDGARLKSKGYDLQAAAFRVNLSSKTLFSEGGIRGTYSKGRLKAGALKLNFGGGRSVAENIEWAGQANVQGQTRDLQIRSRRVEYTADPDIQIYYDAEASDKDSLMRAKKLTWDRDADTVTMEGSCEYYGPESILSAPKVVVYRKEQRAVATGAVRLFVKPEREKGVVTVGAVPPAQPELPEGLKQPDQGSPEFDDELRSGKTARKYPVIVTCQRVDYVYAKGRKQAVITGSPKARQVLRGGAWREIIGTKAIYQEEQELLTILSKEGGRDVRMTNSAGDDLTAETLVISTTAGKEKMTGSMIEGVMKVKEEQETGNSGGGR
jgi:hypothetical protein